MMGKLSTLMKLKRRAWLLVVAILGILLLTNCLGSDSLLDAELPDDGPAPAPTVAAASRFVEKVSRAGESAADRGQFALTLTDQEVTSFVSVRSILRGQLGNLPIEDLGQVQDIPELDGVDLSAWQELLGQRGQLPILGDERMRLRLTIEDAQVHFLSNGRIIVRGNARFLIAQLPVRVVAAPRASEGELVLDFVEGQLGPVPMPEIIFDYLGSGIARALLAGREYAEITEIRVTEGVLTISGRWKQG